MINIPKIKYKLLYLLIITIIFISVLIFSFEPQNIRHYIKLVIPGKVQTKIKDVLMGKEAMDSMKFQKHYNEKKMEIGKRYYKNHV